MASTHTSKVYEHELRSLRDKLLLMGSLVEEMIQKGSTALSTRDTGLAKATIRLDRRINRLECEVDELCMRILATRQPVASDLRFVTAALKIVTDLERIGDLVVHEALDALVARDVERARQLLARDDQIDEHYARIFRDVLALMSRDPSTVYRATRIQSVAKYLERIADHAMNIAESVVFLVKGTDIRHYNRLKESDPLTVHHDADPTRNGGSRGRTS
jgi:phosphate transport system protein